ncbi:MAG: sigma-70 family RNA polymerase sigma factor [Planctomycetota bacterium]|nr:sigma-70 family RNA polymerase sigma factor [Planctomycetota bacterium]
MGEPKNLDLERVLTEQRTEILRFMERHAADLLRFESAQDLYGGLVVDLLSRSPSFESRAEAADRAWMQEAARFYLGNRRKYWGALKRDTGRLLRTGMGAASSSGLVDDFAASQTGPSTFASRREQLVVLTQAMSVLPERDRRLVELAAAGTSNEEIGQQVGMSSTAAAKAKSRALDRLRKAHELARRALARRLRDG